MIHDLNVKAEIIRHLTENALRANLYHFMQAVIDIMSEGETQHSTDQITASYQNRMLTCYKGSSQCT